MLGGLAVSAAMAVQDECEGSRTNSALPAGNGVPLNSGLHVVTGTVLKEQFSCGNDFSPKVRKPYTITKQRERWTEEEHKKFLEALKLYGRAWRRIEEHVGSKTAVQIRSHAQKFFSKIEKESSGTNTSPAEPIEIPPPRPKRKPTHPYPRKMPHSLNKESLRSLSPNPSISDHENQSPISVLSVVCSDALGSTDSNTPNCSLSPVSCAGGSHSPRMTNSEPNPTSEDDRSPSAAMIIDAAIDIERSPKVPKLALLPNYVSEDGLVEDTSTRSLKLFGRTVLITGTPKSHPSNDGAHSWSLYGGLPFPLGPFPKQETVKVIQDSNEKDIQKEGSWTGSNSGSLNESDTAERNMDSESYNNDEKEHTPKPLERSASSNNCMKGFVPYKKRFSFSEEKHTRLCL